RNTSRRGWQPRDWKSRDQTFLIEEVIRSYFLECLDPAVFHALPPYIQRCTIHHTSQHDRLFSNIDYTISSRNAL
uniref:Uncharacterized protein n=1 Tax=Ciona intestinalis TaxID=7719 RepID=H2XZ83_CIOIN